MKVSSLAVFLATGAALLLTAPAVAAGFSVSSVGVGSHGYDWLVGNWSCSNSIPSPMGGPASTKFTAAAVGDAIAIHLSGKDFDASGYLKYIAKTKTWWNPTAYVNGGQANESSQQTGRVVVFTGSAFDPASGTAPIRDTYTTSSATKFTDLSEARVGATWKRQAMITCTKG